MKSPILYMATRLPLPLIGGDRLKSYNTLLLLSRHFDVHAVFISDEKPSEEVEVFFRQICADYKVFYVPKLKCRVNSLKSLINRRPLQVNYYYSKEAQNYIDSKLCSIDLVYCSLVRGASYFLTSPNTKTLDMCDSIALNYANSKRKVSSIFWKLIYYFESKRMLAWEKKCFEIFDNVSVVNYKEYLYWKDLFNDKIWFIPNGVNQTLMNRVFPPVARNGSYLVFFGKMDYQPNIDAVTWFCENILEHLDEGLQLLIIGANPSPPVYQLAKKSQRVEIMGYVEDPYPTIHNALAVVSPMLTGGGIQNKILEAMAIGGLNIVSPLAASGIKDGLHLEHFIIAEHPEEWFDLINSIHRGHERHLNIRQQARKLATENYSWARYEASLLKMIRADNVNDNTSTQNLTESFAT